MHELALTEGVIRVLEEQAVLAKYSRVKTVWLEIGALAQVDPEAMTFCFSAIARGTVAEGAALEIIRVPGRGWCLPCAAAVDLAERFDPCPRCGGHQLQVTTGEEMRVRELEVE